METIRVEHRALRKQFQFITATDRHVMYSGAFGAGKTRAICLKAIARAGSHPNAREFLCRKHLVTFRGTTLKTLLEGDGEAPPVLTPGAYEHNKSERVIRIHDAGAIVYGGLDDMLKLRSGGYSGVGIDEAIETTEADYRELVGRVRLAVPGLPLQVYSATNPGSPSHHLAVRFGCGADNTEAQTGCRVIHTQASDNHHLPPEYIEELNRMTGVAFRRYVLGEWCGSEGLVYDIFARSTHVRTVSGTPSRVVLGVDQGFADAFVCLRAELHGSTWHIAREVYQSGMAYPDKLAAIRTMSAGAEVIAVDPSAAELIAGLRREGLPAVKADNAILPGIGRVQRRLAIVDGEPGLTVDPGCRNLIREFESYEWAPESPGSEKRVDVPVDRDNHAADALRYLVSWLDAERASIAVVDEAWGGCKTETPAFGSLAIPPRYLGADFRAGKIPDGVVWQDRGDQWRLWATLAIDLEAAIVRPWQADRYVIAASVGAGLGFGDSAVVVARLSDRRKVFEALIPDLDPIELARLVAVFGSWVGGVGGLPPVGWHQSGAGEAFGRHLRQRLGWSRIWTAKTVGQVAEVSTQRTGWQGDPDDLRGLLLSYAADLRSGRYINPSRPALDDLGRWVMVDGQAMDFLDADESAGARRQSGSLAIADAIAARMIERASWKDPEDPKIAIAKRNPRTILGMQEAERREKERAERESRPWDDV